MQHWFEHQPQLKLMRRETLMKKLILRRSKKMPGELPSANTNKGDVCWEEESQRFQARKRSQCVHALCQKIRIMKYVGWPKPRAPDQQQTSETCRRVDVTCHLTRRPHNSGPQNFELRKRVKKPLQERFHRARPIFVLDTKLPHDK